MSLSLYAFNFIMFHIAVMPRTAELPDGYIHIFLNAGDDGPDQRGTRNAIHSMFASRRDFDFQLFLSAICLKHQFHLAVSSQLKLCDEIVKNWGASWKYFSTVATISHVWRAHLARIRKTWWTLHQKDIDILKKPPTTRTPPLAIAGRWASIDSFLSCCALQL